MSSVKRTYYYSVASDKDEIMRKRLRDIMLSMETNTDQIENVISKFESRLDDISKRLNSLENRVSHLEKKLDLVDR